STLVRDAADTRVITRALRTPRGFPTHNLTSICKAGIRPAAPADARTRAGGSVGGGQRRTAISPTGPDRGKPAALPVESGVLQNARAPRADPRPGTTQHPRARRLRTTGRDPNRTGKSVPAAGRAAPSRTGHPPPRRLGHA